MKIVRLSASNVLRLKAVEINPDGTIQIVAGKNGAGKSSVLNALWLALGGGAASRDIAKPIRHGETYAEVSLDLGDMTVTRTWDAEKDKSTLTVRAADGALYRSPQTLLDGLVGKLSFDPLAFTRLSPREQREALLDVLGLDFTEQDAERARLYGLRLETGRQKHAYGDLPRLPKNAPIREVSSSDVLEKIAAVQDEQRRLDALMRRSEVLQSEVEQRDARVAEAMTQLDAARRAQAEHLAIMKDQPEYPSITPLRQELEQIEQRNAEARENQRIQAGREAQEKLEQEYTQYTRQIDALDKQKSDAIAAADMPVDGLGFDDTGVLFHGVPFTQASSAEQIRVSLAMAMSLNPDLRVVRIMDGSLLDSDSMAAIRQAAEEHDVQVWIEVVGDATTADPAAVVIEDGQVVER